MDEADEEQKALRAVALQNAQTIFLARHKAERELVEAKEALERKSEELAQQRAWFHLAMEAGQMGAWEWIVATGKVIWSPTLEAIHGLLPGTFGGGFEDVFADIHPEDRERVLAHVRESVERGGDYRIEYRIIKPDGALTWIEARGKLFKDAQGNPERMAGVCMDISARKHVEEALRTSEEFNRSIIESSSDCIKVLDLEGRLVSFEAGLELLGITDPTPFVGKPWTDFWEAEEDRAAAIAAVEKAAAGGEGHFVGFFRTLHGEDKWWDVAISPILDGGKPARLLAVSRDVTARRQMENSLVSQADQLARADRSKDEFLAMLAHELRNPLAPLRNAAEILHLSESSPEERHHAQSIMRRQLENMTRMIDDLLDVSRITEGKIELRRKPVALEAILTAATSMARSSISECHQTLEVSLPSEPIFLNADATRLEQVFTNLLSNACKYGGDGCHIWLSAERVASITSPEVVVRVRDDGAGIDPEILPRVFDLFVQATRSLDRAHGGLGIGLTLVSRLVKLHGGTIEARSEGISKGAEFIVRLPVLKEAPAPAPAPPAAAEPVTPRRILIVDDNTDSARSLAILQNRRGHQTRVAFNGPDAIAAAADFRPEIILLDIGLPGMDGFEVARQIRAMPALAGTFLVAMTGYASAGDRADAAEAGFDEHLVKPIDLEILRDWMRDRVRSL
jgi:PAS domain S-box-containing protein